jgi:alkaline phosphatase D
MRTDSFIITLVILVSGLQSASAKFPDDFATPLEVIAFGSCNRDELPQPLWPVITKDNPDLWIWAGDNIYADWHERPDGQKVKFTINREWVTQRYAAQFNQPGYAAFREKTPIIGTWDDHDYGRNNAGAEYKLKEITRDLALSFMEVPIADPRWQREGLYGAYDFGTSGKMTKVILLDNRYFASGKKANEPDLLGEGQRAWLETTLRRSKADLHILVSGTQIISEEHRWEKWADYPETRAWLLREIAETQIPTVLVSGDRHIHEISVLQDWPGKFPLPDITSSGLSHSWDEFPGETNRHRVGKVFTGLGYGLIKIDWSGHKPQVLLAIKDTNGNTQIAHQIE